MGKLREGPMACTKANEISFTNELTQRKNDCEILLTQHEQQTPDIIWTPSDGEGQEPFSSADRVRLKLVTTVTFDDNEKVIWPPKFTRLSDELVYLATKFLKATERAANYPYDFNERGDIRDGRVPSGVSPIVWAHGLPFFPVFKGYYILCGRQHAWWVGWLLNKKEHKIMIAYPMWTIGPVVAPGSAVSLSRTVTRQMHLHVPQSAKDVERKWEKNEVARDVVSTAHYLPSVVPKTPSKGFILTPIYRVEGYHVRCGPKTLTTGKGLEIGRRTLSTHGVSDFDYDRSLKSSYVNEENPAAFPDDDDEEEGSAEEDWEATDQMSAMDRDEDFRDDESFNCPSEESVESGDIVMEPPRKKLKKVALATDSAFVQHQDRDQTIHTTKELTSTVHQTALTTSANDTEAIDSTQTFESRLAVERITKLAMSIRAESLPNDQRAGSSIAGDSQKDTVVQDTATASASETTTEIQIGEPEQVNIHETKIPEKIVIGPVSPTDTPLSTVNADTNTGPVIHRSEDAQSSTEHKPIDENEHENGSEMVADTQLVDEPLPRPADVGLVPDPDCFQD